MNTEVAGPGQQQRLGRVGDYQVIRRLGHGAMAEVLLGQLSGPRGFSRPVAIKRLHPDLAQDETVVKMFIDEARISSRLSHENIAQVLDFGNAGESYYIAMEYVEGCSLRQLLDEIAPLPAAVAAHVVAKVCAALDHAHGMVGDDGQPLALVHRDVKPPNVLISAEGRIKLIDFGVAKAAQRLQQTVGLVLKGSYAYMSPEQASNQPLDHRSDIFSAGTMLYEMLAGQNPFVGATPIDTLERVRHGRMLSLELAAPQLDEELASVCGRAMAVDPERRFPNAGEMQVALERFCHHQRFSAAAFRSWSADHSARLAVSSPPASLPAVTAEVDDVPPTTEVPVGFEPTLQLRKPPIDVDRVVSRDGALPSEEQRRIEPTEVYDEREGGGADVPFGDGLPAVETETLEIDEPPADLAQVRRSVETGPQARHQPALSAVPTTLPRDSFPELAPLLNRPQGRPAAPAVRDGAEPRRDVASRLPVAASIPPPGPVAHQRPAPSSAASTTPTPTPGHYSSIKVVLISLFVTLVIVAAAVALWII